MINSYQIQYGFALRKESHLEVVFFKSQLLLRLITNDISAQEIPAPKFSFTAMMDHTKWLLYNFGHPPKNRLEPQGP